MAIEPGDVPTAAVQAISTGMISGAAAAAFAPSKLSRTENGALSLAMPHRIAYLSFGRVGPDLVLRTAAQMGSWRFLVHEKQTVAGKDPADEGKFLPVAAATAVQAGEDYQLGDLSEGPFVDGTEEAIRRAESLEQVRAGRFEACLLMIPSLYVVALWLQDRDGDGKTDILLTIPPSHSDLAPFKPMAPPEFVGVLNNLATKALVDAA